MKRWLCWLFLVVGVGFLLRIPRRPVSPYLRPQAAGNQSVLHHNELVSSWCRALRAATPASLRQRAGPLEFFATQFGFLTTGITDDDGPPWLDDRGPPGRSHDLVTSCKAAGQAASTSGTLPARNSGRPADQNQRAGFAPAFS
jgi:hypothetical protein